MVFYCYTLDLYAITAIVLIVHCCFSKVTDVRLPTHLAPIHYQLRLVPFIIPDNFTIKGNVAITMEANEGGAQQITLHSAEINITHDSGKCIQVTEL